MEVPCASCCEKPKSNNKGIITIAPPTPTTPLSIPAKRPIKSRKRIVIKLIQLILHKYKELISLHNIIIMKIKTFTFNQFQENTFVISDNTSDCIIIDPGCYLQEEKNELENYIIENKLKPIYLINTHCHIDHILGNNFISKRWGLDLTANKKDLDLLKNSQEIAKMYGFVNFEPSPLPKKFLDEGDIIKFGNSELNILFTPGHAPGHISLYSKKYDFILSGDVLFKHSIGRTDLPGGDFNVLINSIKNKLFTLNNETIVYCGHGPSTTIGEEKKHNPFLT